MLAAPPGRPELVLRAPLVLLVSLVPLVQQGWLVCRVLRALPESRAVMALLVLLA